MHTMGTQLLFTRPFYWCFLIQDIWVNDLVLPHSVVLLVLCFFVFFQGVLQTLYSALLSWRSLCKFCFLLLLFTWRPVRGEFDRTEKRHEPRDRTQFVEHSIWIGFSSWGIYIMTIGFTFWGILSNALYRLRYKARRIAQMGLYS